MGSYTTPTNCRSKKEKLRVLLIPFFATSHIQPFTELAIRLAAANDAVEATVAVTPANVPIVQSVLDLRQHSNVKIASYPFPTVDGIPKGVENLGKTATPEESVAIRVASLTESVMRPVQETLVKEQSPDAIVTDVLLFWNGSIADELGVPCVAFSTMGSFSMLAVRHLLGVAIGEDGAVQVPRFPEPCIRIPWAELPWSLRRKEYSVSYAINSLQANCFGLAMNTSSELENPYCELYTGEGYVKRAYFLGPVAQLRSSAPLLQEEKSCYIMDWLDSKPAHSVVYVSFGSMAHAKNAQLDELAAGLEASGKSFLWVVRGKEEWTPPVGWEERVQLQNRGFIIRTWAPQTTILGHQAVGAFVTHCGWSSILETVAAGVPVLTWPVFYEQFITEKQVTEVLGIGERLWPDGAGLRSECYDDHEVVPGQDVARALTKFMRPGGEGDAARIKVKNLAAKLHAAVAEGGSSHRDLHRLIDDLLMAKAEAKRT